MIVFIIMNITIFTIVIVKFSLALSSIVSQYGICLHVCKCICACVYNIYLYVCYVCEKRCFNGLLLSIALQIDYSVVTIIIITTVMIL